jgi:hypothetical protein
MKNSIIALLLFITSANFISAQDNDKPIRLAFVLSPQLSWINSDNENIASGGNLFGYNFGVAMHKFFAPNYAFNTGLTINTTGGVLKYTTGSGSSITTETKTMHLKYLEIPFGLHLKTNEFRRMVYYGQFGLSTMLNIKATDQDGKSLSSDINFFDFAYHFGGGVEYSIGGSNYLMIGLQFNNGITDITSKSTPNDRAVLNRLVFQFGLIF